MTTEETKDHSACGPGSQCECRKRRETELGEKIDAVRAKELAPPVFVEKEWHSPFPPPSAWLPKPPTRFSAVPAAAGAETPFNMGEKIAAAHKGNFAFPDTPPLRSHDVVVTHEGTLRPAIRTFDTGATRDTDEDKLEYAGFLDPLVLRRFATYMHKNRRMKDGSLRSSSNWKNGFPREVLMQSAFRHFMDFWFEHSGEKTEAVLEESICALMFNLQAYLRQVLKEKV